MVNCLDAGCRWIDLHTTSNQSRMATLVHITASSQDDPRCRRLAGAIRQYMQADHPETHTEQTHTEQTHTDHPQAETHTDHPHTDTEPRTETPSQTLAEIHPPPPQPSSHPFTSHITPTLAMLAANLPLQRMYRPSRQSRPVDVWERGYWLYLSHIYPHIYPDVYGGILRDNKVTDLWQFLSEIIQHGKAGWGVWGVKSQSEEAGACQIKVYCWGEIVPYIYLLFLVGSDRRLNPSLQWRDAADKVVVHM